MDDNVLALVKEVHHKAIEQLRAAGELDTQEPARMPHTALPELPRDSEFYREWNTYRSEVAGLLALGCRGTWVLIKGETILGIYGRWEHAYIAGLEKALRQELQPPFMIHQVVADEAVSTLERFKSPWPYSLSPLAKTA